MSGGCHEICHEILLPSAVHLEERLTVSQAVPEPGQQSVSQKHTVWVFLSVANTASSSGDSFVRIVKQWPNGNAAGYGFLIVGSNPGPANMPPPPPQRVRQPGFEPPTIIAAVCCVTSRPAAVCQCCVSPLLVAFSAKTFDPPPTPPPQKK